MDELEILRNKIDEIDRQILLLFLERMEICSKIADYKQRNDIPVLDRERERQILEEKLSLLENSDMVQEVSEFFESMMAISRARQIKMQQKKTEW